MAKSKTRTASIITGANKSATSAIKNVAKNLTIPSSAKKATTRVINSGQFDTHTSLGGKIQQYTNPIIQEAANGYNSIAASGANLANSVSAAGQQAAMEYNASQASMANAITQQYLEQQMTYNSAEAAKAREYNTQMYERALADNRKLAQESRDWQEMMANTAYQRAIKDMEAAGINPILAYTNGGATTPTGATVSMSPMTTSAASVSAGSGVGASIGGYSGQGYQGSEAIALMAGVLGGISSGLDALTKGVDEIENATGIELGSWQMWDKLLRMLGVPVYTRDELLGSGIKSEYGGGHKF